MSTYEGPVYESAARWTPPMRLPGQWFETAAPSFVEREEHYKNGSICMQIRLNYDRHLMWLPKHWTLGCLND